MLYGCSAGTDGADARLGQHFVAAHRRSRINLGHVGDDRSRLGLGRARFARPATRDNATA